MIVFRADGNSQIGSGHVMRCLSIAEAARDLGEKCIFITASDDMTSVIKEKSFDNIVLNTDYREMESEDILPALKAFTKPIVFVDSYYVSKEYLKALKVYCEENGGKLIYMDDVKKFAYPCDTLINYQIHGRIDEYDRIYEGGRKPKYIIGTNYVPLRKEFLSLKDREVKKQANSILVSTGGSDPEHLTIELMRIAKHSNKTFHFVVGAVNSDRPLIEQEAENCTNISLHVNVKNMSELMQICDVAISASGSTLYELCATQTPAVTFVLAENQIPIAEGFSSKEIIHNCGDVRELGAHELAGILMNEAMLLCDNYDRRQSLSGVMKAVVDGNGASRILKEILDS